jgi:hypothetical protein
METIKMDDPRLDESYSFLFAFRKGDLIVKKDQRDVRGEVIDGVYVGEIPGPNAGAVHPRGRTLYEIKMRDRQLHIIDETDVERAKK